jgi:hypothetical protein
MPSFSQESLIVQRKCDKMYQSGLQLTWQCFGVVEYVRDARKCNMWMCYSEYLCNVRLNFVSMINSHEVRFSMSNGKESVRKIQVPLWSISNYRSMGFVFDHKTQGCPTFTIHVRRQNAFRLYYPGEGTWCRVLGYPKPALIPPTSSPAVHCPVPVRAEICDSSRWRCS